VGKQVTGKVGRRWGRPKAAESRKNSGWIHVSVGRWQVRKGQKETEWCERITVVGRVSHYKRKLEMREESLS